MAKFAEFHFHALGRIETYSGGKSPPKTPANNIPTRTAATATLAATTHHLVCAVFFTSAPLYR
jgi:hypothetical protein